MSDEKRKITIEDLTKIRYIGDPQLSPDGRWIAFVANTPNPMKKGTDNHIYIVSTAGGDPLQLTRSGRDSSPRWSPDSEHLAFVSSRADKPQIYILPIAYPGEPRALTNHENGATSPVWSPDGASIAYLSRMNAAERANEDRGEKSDAPQDELEARHRKERRAEDEKNRLDPRPVENIPFREGTRFLDDRYAQIYIISTDPTADDNKPRRMTHADVNYSEPRWSASGATLFTIRATAPNLSEPAYHGNVYLIDVESGNERRFTDDEYTYWDVKPSSDTTWMAVSRRTPPRATYGLNHLTLISLEGDEVIDLTAEFDRSVQQFQWAGDNQLYFVMATEAHHEIYKYDLNTRTMTPVVQDKQSLWGTHACDNGALAYVSRTTTRLEEVFYLAPNSDEAQQLTVINEKLLQEVAFAETHHLRFTAPDGQELDGWYLLPPDYEEGKQYPLALNIHGGPHIMWTPDYRAMWHEWQTHAAAGYVVFYCNPRGSDGYGQDFRASIINQWGDFVAEDILAGVQALVAKGVVDETRMAISGGSYGGYMTSWMIAHQPDMFVAAVSQRGVYNLTSFVGTSDVPTLLESEFETTIWGDYDKLWQHSPLAYAHQIKTPTLIIHSESDYRVPIEQGEQFFAMIRRATDTPVKMLRYPREGHEMSRNGEPAHRISRLTEMLNWFNRYCQSED